MQKGEGVRNLSLTRILNGCAVARTVGTLLADSSPLGHHSCPASLFQQPRCPPLFYSFTSFCRSPLPPPPPPLSLSSTTTTIPPSRRLRFSFFLFLPFYFLIFPLPPAPEPPCPHHPPHPLQCLSIFHPPGRPFISRSLGSCMERRNGRPLHPLLSYTREPSFIPALCIVLPSVGFTISPSIITFHCI